MQSSHEATRGKVRKRTMYDLISSPSQPRPHSPYPPHVFHLSVYRTMMAISVGARLLTAHICPMGDSVRKETADGCIQDDKAEELEWHYSSCLACSYSPPINRAVLPKTFSLQSLNKTRRNVLIC